MRVRAVRWWQLRWSSSGTDRDGYPKFEFRVLKWGLHCTNCLVVYPKLGYSKSVQEANSSIWVQCFLILKFEIQFLGSILSTPKKPEFKLPDQTVIEPPINDKFKHEGVGADWEAARLCFQKELLYIKHYFTFTHIHTSSFYLVLVKIWVSNFNVTTSSHSMVLFSSAWFEFSLQVFIFVNSIWFFRTFLLTGKENCKLNIE